MNALYTRETAVGLDHTVIQTDAGSSVLNDRNAIFNEKSVENPFLKNNVKNENISAKSVLPIVQPSQSPSYNPFTRKPIAEPKETASSAPESRKMPSIDNKSNCDSFFSNLVVRCQVPPTEISHSDIIELFNNNMYRTILMYFYPISLSLESSNFHQFLLNSYYVSFSLAKLQRISEADTVISHCLTCFSRIALNVSHNSESLPDEVSSSIVHIPFQLLMLRLSIHNMNRDMNVILTEMLHMLRLLRCRYENNISDECDTELWNSVISLDSSSVFTSITSLQEEIMSVLVHHHHFDTLFSLLTDWIDHHISSPDVIYYAFRCAVSILDTKRLLQLRKLYVDSLNDTADEIMLMELFDGMIAVVNGKTKDAINCFTHVQNNSKDITIQIASANNAAVCYYQIGDLQKACQSIENVIVINPALYMTEDLISTLMWLYDCCYVSTESINRKKAMFMLSQKYHLELFEQKIFGL